MLKLFFVLILTVGGFGITRLNWWQIKTIECRLNHYPCPLNLEPILLSFRGWNIFQLESDFVKKQLISFDPTLTEIKISKQLPRKLIIELSRRLPIAEIKLVDSSANYYLDKGGFIYTPDILVSQPLPQIIWSNNIPLLEGESAEGRELARLLNTLNAYYVQFSQIAKINNNYEITTQLGPVAIIAVDSDITAAVASLQLILTNLKIEEKLPVTIDLRFAKPVLSY